MNNIFCLNKISKIGTDKFSDNFTLVDDIAGAQGVLVRSAAMHDMDLPDSLLSIARAGAGYNNIPVDKCTEQGICVFNTPGANANAVKELVITALLMTSRKIYDGLNWSWCYRCSCCKRCNSTWYEGCRLRPLYVS